MNKRSNKAQGGILNFWPSGGGVLIRDESLLERGRGDYLKLFERQSIMES